MRKKLRKHKKYGNRLARDRRLSDIFTKHIGVVNLPGDKNSHVVDIDTHKIKNKLTQQQAFDVTGHQHKWSVLLCVFGRANDGKEYFKAEEVVSPRICYQNEIGESMNGLHNKMYEEFNKNHFISLGWIATPHDREFDLDEMYKLFKKLGAFEFIAKWEQAE
jgi:hypothetical protein